MRQYFLPEGQALTLGQYTTGALDRPLSGWRTFGFGLRDTVEQSVLGTAAREFMTPDLALRQKTPGGRYTAPVYEPERPEDVQARGDELYQDESQYKASPFYRENVPFEPGMTKSRAMALSAMQDSKAIREFYSAKRPVTSLLGGVAGAALAPENYIPIINEAAGVAVVARVGKIFGRAVTGGADAALNTAIFQTLTASDRARLGDDASWQAIAENSAFAALAGGAIGSILGGAAKLRGRYTDAKLTPEEIVSREIPRREIGGPSARFSEMTSVKVEQVKFTTDAATRLLDRIETPALRAKAAQVMNDAITGLVIDGEVRLGEQTRAHVEELQRLVRPDGTIDSSTSFSVPAPEPALPQLTGVYAALDLAAKPRADSRAALKAKAKTPKAESVDPLDGAGDWRRAEITATVDGEKVKVNAGDAVDFLKAEVNARSPESARPQDQSAPAPLDQGQREGGAKLGDVTDVEAELEGVRAQLEKQGFDVARSQDVLDAPIASSPEVRAMVESARAEGFDPEVGTHDLMDDVAIMESIDAVTPEEKAALAAADQTFESAEAWGEVMAFASKCVIK